MARRSSGVSDAAAGARSRTDVRHGARLSGASRIAELGRGQLGQCAAGSIYPVLKKVSAQKLLEQAEVSRGLTPAGEDGLRPASRCLWEHIRRLHADHGVTVFLTTHYLDEVDALCDGTLVIDDGEIVAERSPDSLTARVS